MDVVSEEGSSEDDTGSDAYSEDDGINLIEEMEINEELPLSAMVPEASVIGHPQEEGIGAEESSSDEDISENEEAAPPHSDNPRRSFKYVIWPGSNRFHRACLVGGELRRACNKTAAVPTSAIWHEEFPKGVAACWHSSCLT